VNNYQEYNRIITMVGTSFLTNYAKNNEDPCYRELSKVMMSIDKNGQAPFNIWEKFETQILAVKNNLVSWAMTINDPASLSAEIKSLQEICRLGGLKQQIYLIASDTLMSRFAAEVILSYITSQKAYGKGPFSQAEIIFNPAEHVIEGLQVVDPERLENQGLEGLLNIVDIICGKNYENASFNITGGFKGLIPYLTLIAQAFNLPAYYIYEDSDRLIKLPLLPFKFDFSLIEENYLAFERIKPKLSSRGKRLGQRIEDKTRLLKDVLGDLSVNEDEAQKELKLLVKAGLIVVDSESVTLTALGRILYKRHEQLYLKKDFHRGNLFSGLVELKLFNYFYEIAYSYRARVKNGFVYRSESGVICEMDLLVELNEQVIIIEVKLFSETVNRFRDIINKVDRKLQNEALKEFLDNECASKKIEYRVYLVSHKEPPEMFLNMISKYMNEQLNMAKNLNLSWHLVKLDPSYKNKFNWNIKDENITIINTT